MSVPVLMAVMFVWYGVVLLMVATLAFMVAVVMLFGLNVKVALLQTVVCSGVCVTQEVIRFSKHI